MDNNPQNSCIPVFISCDDNYTKYACVTIASIVHNTKRSVCFYILCQSLLPENKERIFKCANGNTVEFIQVDIGKFSHFDVVLKHLSIAACFRYLIADICKSDKAIYLDCDIIVRADIGKLFDINIDGFYAGVIEDVIKRKYLRALNLKHYFNSGVMLMNVKKMREDAITEKLFVKSAELNGISKFLDQDVLNAVLADKVKFLEMSWSACSPIFRKTVRERESCEDINEALYNPKIVHFTGPDKPWIIPYGITAHPYTPEFFFYLGKTPFKNLESEIRENFNPLKRFFWYLKRHTLFFLRPHFYKMRALYRKIDARAKNAEK